MPFSEASFRARADSRAKDKPCSAREAPRSVSVEFDADVRDHEGHGLAVADRLAERFALVDVRNHVVENCLAGSDGHGRPTEAGQSNRVGILGLALTGTTVAEQSGLRHGDVGEDQATQAGGAQTHTGIRLDDESFGVGFDDEEGGLAVEFCGDDEEFGRSRGGHQALDAVELVAAGGAHCLGLQGKRIEQCAWLVDHHCRAGDLLAGEGRKVGLLLRVGAPLRQCNCNAAGCEDRKCKSHVSVRKCFGNKRIGDCAAIGSCSVEFFGNVDQRDTELGRALGEIGGCLRCAVGVVRCWTQNLGRELTHRLDDHLLVVVRGEVEVVGVLARVVGQALGCTVARDLLESASSGTEGFEARLGALVGHAIDGLTQIELLGQFRTGDLGKHTHGCAHGVASDRVQADGGRVAGRTLGAAALRARFAALSALVGGNTVLLGHDHQLFLGVGALDDSYLTHQ